MTGSTHAPRQLGRTRTASRPAGGGCGRDSSARSTPHTAPHVACGLITQSDDSRSVRRKACPVGLALTWASGGARSGGAKMKLSELIEDLTAALDDNGDREVLIAQQPSWPLAATVVQVYDPAYDAEPTMSDEDAEALWIATAEVSRYDRSPYAPRVAWSEQF